MRRAALHNAAPAHPHRAGLELAFGALLLAISVRSLKRFFRGKLSPDGVVIALRECARALLQLLVLCFR